MASERMLLMTPLKIPEDRITRLKEKFPHLDISEVVTPLPNAADFANWKGPGKEEYEKVNYLVTLTNLPAQAEDAPNLKYVHLISSGTNHWAGHPFYTKTTVPITSSRGLAGPPIAEWVIMTALVHSHKYNLMLEGQVNRTWTPPVPFINTHDMVGQRIGIVGYGGIGRQVGRIAKAMGMEIYALTATPKDTPERRRDTGYIVPGTGDPEGEIPAKWYHGLDKASLHEFLKQDLDIVVLSLPLTADTQKLLSTAEFEILAKRNAFVSNVSRGQIIDQPALIEALESGKLRGAALDVTDPEPLPADDPLWTAPNVIISPHLSSLSSAYTGRVLDVVEENLTRLGKGEPLLNLVNRERGY